MVRTIDIKLFCCQPNIVTFLSPVFYSWDKTVFKNRASLAHLKPAYPFEYLVLFQKNPPGISISHYQPYRQVIPWSKVFLNLMRHR